jgi:predicted protein tyrosine phosphatase
MPQVEVPFSITVCGIQELAGHASRRVTHVLSIIDPDEAEPDAFESYGEHARLGLRFHDVIEETPGFQAPQPHHVEEMLAFGKEILSEPEMAAHLLVHCHMGISRSTAAMTLLLAQAQPDLHADQIFGQVLHIREKAWPNLRILSFGAERLGRADEFIPAAARLYRHQLDKRPDIKDFFISAGRGREIELALSVK